MLTGRRLDEFHVHLLAPSYAPSSPLLTVQVGDSAADSAVLNRQAARRVYQYPIRLAPSVHSSQMLP